MLQSEKVIIETPEQIGLEFPLAGIGSRFLAVALDYLLITLVRALVWILLLAIMTQARLDEPEMANWVIAIGILLSFTVSGAYFVLFETFWNGQTPGKRALNLRVIDDSGRPITFYAAIARNLMRLVDGIPLYGIGILSALISRKNKRLGDFVAGTIVVRERPLQESAPIWDDLPEGDSARFADVRLSTEEAALIEAFLARRGHLEGAVRQRAAEQVRNRLAGSLNLDSEGRDDPEALIEDLARGHRRAARYRR